MMLELLTEVIDQPFYDDLRTKQQLGYILNQSTMRDKAPHQTITVECSR